MFKSVNLEISLKPFKQTDDAYIRGVCKKVYTQWQALLKDREDISIMIWAADGSEILDYAGSLEDEFEWCRFLGVANRPLIKEGEHTSISSHARRQNYMENAPKMTYAILKKIVSTFKEECKLAFPKSSVRVGATFDIGPEFAISDFKYNRHNEICSGEKLSNLGFVDATARLKADNRYYAAYPDGIPEGEPFGRFLGKQANCFLKDMGFDYLWLSNGLGYSADPWKKTGKLFDGERYYPEKLALTKERVFEFWKLFREGCPDIPLETRGTNNSVGIDFASDAVPLYDIYNADLNIIAPPNSPWAALNDDFGLEIMGHMTRIAELPNQHFPFRYYLHDPWFINSPWYDRYDSTPCDIYLPMAISRIDGEGKLMTANKFNILTVDNSYGDMPDACVNEPLPHFLKAEKDSPDEPAPFVWIYPMREYTTSCDAELLREMNLGDNFISGAINDGFPLCCVASTDNFLHHDVSVYKKSTLISPAPESREMLEKLRAFANDGIGVIIYATEARLNEIPDFCNLTKINIEKESAAALREAAEHYGWRIRHAKKVDGIKPPTIAISRFENAHFISAYNPNTTTDTYLRTPLGAPILLGCEAELKDGFASYRFARSEHRECRVYVEQQNGIISCREQAPGNNYYRRAILIKGLKDATVRLFGEPDCPIAASNSKSKLYRFVLDERFCEVEDEVYGKHLLGEHIDGDIYFIMGKPSV